MGKESEKYLLYHLSEKVSQNRTKQLQRNMKDTMGDRFIGGALLAPSLSIHTFPLVRYSPEGIFSCGGFWNCGRK